MSNTTLLDRAKQIPVPELGEIIKIKSVELLCVWMQLNNLKALRWQGNLLVTVLDDKKTVEQEKDGSQ